MASNNVNPAQAKEALNQIKMEAANEVGVTLNENYNGNLTAAQAGKIGGQMVKKMIENFENQGASANANANAAANQSASNHNENAQTENNQNNDNQNRSKRSK